MNGYEMNRIKSLFQKVARVHFLKCLSYSKIITAGNEENYFRCALTVAWSMSHGQFTAAN